MRRQLHFPGRIDQEEVMVMDDPTIPPPAPHPLIRACEASRLQRQLLARAYQQLCPQIRWLLHQAKDPTPRVEGQTGSSSAARVAAGA
jgi:hypothetical protein